MAFEKSIIKAQVASSTTFEFKPREFGGPASEMARSFVSDTEMRAADFKISELVAQQAGISRLESDAHQDKINTQVLGRLKEIQEKAYTEGYELGLIEGSEKAFQDSKVDFGVKMQALEHLLKKIEDLKSQLLIDNEGELVKLVFFTAKKMALRDLEGNHEGVLELLKSVVGEAQEDEKIVVKLSGEDLLFIESLQERSGQPIESLQRIKFVIDDAITSGGCSIETEYGTVNATVEERVERTWQTLASRIPQKMQPKKD